MTDTLPLALSVLVALVWVAWVAFEIRRSKPENLLDVLKAIAAPGLAAGLLIVTVIAKRSLKKEGATYGLPLEPEKKEEESRGEQVRRIIEERADEAEQHILEEATDDEVAARGADLFDPGA